MDIFILTLHFLLGRMEWISVRVLYLVRGKRAGDKHLFMYSVSAV
jgi:hypothetical protein